MALAQLTGLTSVAAAALAMFFCASLAISVERRPAKLVSDLC
jgi:hypothetical protein